MSNEWKFPQYHKSELIKKLCGKYKFINETFVEQLIVDFEAYHVFDGKLDLAIRGGMCALLHIDDDAHRLSNDVDFVTTLPIDKVRDIVKNTRLGGKPIVVANRKTHIPEHLLYGTAEFDSCIVKKNKIKIDFLCGVEKSIFKTVSISSPTILDFNFPGTYVALDKGSLITDKITALSSAKHIGVKYDEHIVKHTYDISHILQKLSLDDLYNYFLEYVRRLKFKIELMNKELSTTDIVISIDTRVSNLVDFKNDDKLNEQYSNLCSKFKGKYLKKTDEISDQFENALLTRLLVRHMVEFEQDNDARWHSKSIHNAITRYKQSHSHSMIPYTDQLPDLAPGLDITKDEFSALEPHIQHLILDISSTRKPTP